MNVFRTTTRLPIYFHFAKVAIPQGLEILARTRRYPFVAYWQKSPQTQVGLRLSANDRRHLTQIEQHCGWTREHIFLAAILSAGRARVNIHANTTDALPNPAVFENPSAPRFVWVPTANTADAPPVCALFGFDCPLANHCQHIDHDLKAVAGLGYNKEPECIDDLAQVPPCVSRHDNTDSAINHDSFGRGLRKGHPLYPDCRGAEGND